jgi:alpha-beta hydrolase superfamily lysophospholipase
MERREGYLSSKGVRLFHWSIIPDDYSANLLFVHGMAEHSGRYQEVAEHFASLGYCCHALDLRGLGRSEGPRGHADSFWDLIDDTALFADQIHRIRCF